MKSLLGYRSQRACVRGLLNQGLTPLQIERQTGLDHEAVRVLIKDIRRLDLAPVVAERPRVPHLTVSLERHALEALGPAAARRGVTEGELIRAVIGVLAREPALVDAVLDDEVAA